MRPRLVIVHDQERMERLAVAESAPREPAPAPEEESQILPGSSRRDWVYREISQLGTDPAPWVERD